MTSTPSGTPSLGARPDEVRRHNRTVLLRRLHVDGPCTRASLATELGLNRSTIKALVDGLAESGVVEERVPRQRSGAGRPSLLVLPQPHAAVVLAVDVRVEQVAIALVGLGGEILGRNSWNLRVRTREPEEVITHVVDSAIVLAADLGVRMVAAGVVGARRGPPLRRARARGAEPALDRRAARRPARRRVRHADHGRQRRGARRARRAPARCRARQPDAVYVTADVGVGGGVISDGSALRGTAGYVGELGHMVVRPGGRPCYCGSTGCWETEVGEPALCRALGLREGAPRGAVVAELRALATSPDLVRTRLAEFAEWLTVGLVNVVNVLGPGAGGAR